MANQPRITVIETVNHQIPDENPYSVESRFSRFLDSDEQPYERNRLKATEEWQPLDCGWIKHIGMVMLSNVEKKPPQVNFTDEANEVAVLTPNKDLEVTYNPDNPSEKWIIPAGESMRACPFNAKALHIRCTVGTVCYALFVLPS